MAKAKGMKIYFKRCVFHSIVAHVEDAFRLLTKYEICCFYRALLQLTEAMKLSSCQLSHVCAVCLMEMIVRAK